MHVANIVLTAPPSRLPNFITPLRWHTPPLSKRQLERLSVVPPPIRLRDHLQSRLHLALGTSTPSFAFHPSTGSSSVSFSTVLSSGSESPALNSPRTERWGYPHSLASAKPPLTASTNITCPPSRPIGPTMARDRKPPTPHQVSFEVPTHRHAMSRTLPPHTSAEFDLFWHQRPSVSSPTCMLCHLDQRCANRLVADAVAVQPADCDLPNFLSFCPPIICMCSSPASFTFRGFNSPRYPSKTRPSVKLHDKGPEGNAIVLPNVQTYHVVERHRSHEVQKPLSRATWIAGGGCAASCTFHFQGLV